MSLHYIYRTGGRQLLILVEENPIIERISSLMQMNHYRTRETYFVHNFIFDLMILFSQSS